MYQKIYEQIAKSEKIMNWIQFCKETDGPWVIEEIGRVQSEWCVGDRATHPW
jgi:hypothetical protein